MVATPEPKSNRPRGHGDPKQMQRGKIIIIVIFAVIAIYALTNAWLQLRRPTLPSEIDGVVVFQNLSNEVVEGPITYDHHPPAGGPHAQWAQLCGYYRVPIADENAVASLATGAVWIAYQPEMSDEEYEDLAKAVRGELDVLLAPYPGLEHKVVLTAWERQLTLDTIHDNRLGFFMKTYQNRDWAPNVNATCAEGVGLPLPDSTTTPVE